MFRGLVAEQLKMGWMGQGQRTLNFFQNDGLDGPATAHDWTS